MDSSDFEVIQACDRWLAAGQRCELITVVSSWGSSPRPPGSLLGLREDGCVVGSVSGGCIEDDLIDEVRIHGMRRERPTRVAYGVADEAARRVGLPCGGRLELVIEPLGRHSRVSELLAELGKGRTIVRVLDLDTGTVQLLPGAAAESSGIQAHSLRTVLGPRRRLLIIGAGQLTRFVVAMARMLDYRIEVCDPRIEYASQWDPAAAPLSGAMPDDFIIAARPDRETAILALTHDPKLDDMGLLEALRSPAFYVGALGSCANNDKRRIRLEALGLPERQVARLHGPVGLPIGSRQPAEIAISILAHLTAVKNGCAS